MKLLLTILLALSLSSCDAATDFMYENFSLQKNIDMADEESRKNINGDFKLDDFGYIFPPNVGRFIQNGFTYQAAIDDEAYNEDVTKLPAGKKADIYLHKDANTIYVEAENTSGTEIDILDAPLTFIEISAFELEDMSFDLAGIEMGDALYEMQAKVPDKEFIELRQNSKDLQNDQYYMYLNGKYVVIYTLYQGKLSQVEIIPNERLADYE